MGKSTISMAIFQVDHRPSPRVPPVKPWPFARTHHPPVITIFIAGMFTIPSHGW